MKKAIREYLRFVIAIFGLILLAGGIGGYILVNQRLRLPWQDRYTLKVELADGAAITPGQGQTVTVSGIKVGEISKVELKDGRAVVSSAMDPEMLPKVYRDATVLLRPRTLLADQTLELDPGHARAGVLGDRTLDVANTLPNVNVADVLSSLDTDTRAYMRVLLNSASGGLKGRAVDLRKTFASTEPVLKGTKQVTDALADRRVQTRRLIRNLNQLSGELAGRDDSIRKLVSAADTTFGTLADEEQPLGESVSLLPGTLKSADAALAELRPFSRELQPTLTRLSPTARKLDPALRAARPLFADTPPDLAKIRRFSVAARPVVRNLRPATTTLASTLPELTRSFDQLRYFTNELAYEPPGPQRSYLFWASWFSHNVNSLFSTGDANGAWWRLTLVVGCEQLTQIPNLPSPILNQALSSTGVCSTANTNP